MGVRKSDIMAFTAILAGAGAGLGLTNLYAHSQRQAAQDELITVVESGAPHIVTRMRMHRSDGDHDRDHVKVMEFRREARGQAREAQARAREMRAEVRVGKAFALQEALEGLESLEALESLESLEALESLDVTVINLEALEQAMEELEFEIQGEFDGDVTIDVQVDDADDQHKKKKRKRRIIVKRPGNDGPGN